MLKSLQGRLGLLFTAFVLLVLVSVGATYWGLETQRQDGVLINLAGRQRMLTQQMARLAFESGAGETTTNTALKEVEHTFDQTLHALLDGGPAPYPPQNDVLLPVTRDIQIRPALNQASHTWDDFHARLDELQRTSRDDPSFATTLQSIEEETSILAGQADEVVRLYETGSTARVNRLRAIQVSFLAGALALLGVGALVTRRSALKPLQELGQAAARLGEDLDTAVQVDGPVEMQALSGSFEAMRLRLRASRQELVASNDDLEARVAQRTHELEMLNVVSREISSWLDVQQVLNSVTEKARVLLGSEVAALCLVDEGHHWLRLQAMSGPQSAVVGQVTTAGQGLAGVVLGNEQAVACGVGSCQDGCRMLSAPYRASHLAASLRVSERVSGALCVGSQAQNQFSGEAVGMLTRLANAAATALENARLYAQAERVATLEERRRMAAEMHDGLGQTLSYLGLMTDQVVDFLSEGKDDAALERLRKTREAIGKATIEARRAINSLMDESPSSQDLCKRLQNGVDEFAAESNLSVHWLAQLETAPDCPQKVAEQVLQVAREALNNVAQHAQAQRVSVRVGRTDGQYFVSVEDDGRGFDASQPGPQGHFGLQIMRARAAHIGGRLQVDSQPGSGTRLTLTWPVGAGE